MRALLRSLSPLPRLAALLAATAACGGAERSRAVGGGPRDPCRSKVAARNLSVTPVWEPPTGARPLVGIVEVGDLVAVCSAAALHLLRPGAAGLTSEAEQPLDGCRAMASAEGSLAVLGDGGVTLFLGAATGDLGSAATVPLEGDARDVALAAGALLVATENGARRWSFDGARWTEQPRLGAGQPVTAVAADGASAYLAVPLPGETRVERHPLSGGEPTSVHFEGVAESLVVRGGTGLALTGGFGATWFDTGSSFGATPVGARLLGFTAAGRVVGDDVVVASTNALWRLGPLADPAERGSVYRPGRGAPGGQWYVGVATAGDDVLALRSGGVDRVVLDPYVPGPILVTERVYLEDRAGSGSVLMKLINRGSTDLVVDRVDSDSEQWSGGPWQSDAPATAGSCPPEIVVPARDRGLLQVDYRGTARSSSATLTLRTNDPDLTDLELPVRLEAPPTLLAAGQPAPDFAVPVLGGGEIGPRDLRGRVAYLKFFNPG